MSADTFAARLKAELDKRSWSARELGRRAGISGQYVASLLSGAKESPSLDVAARIADALGVSLDALAGRKRRGVSSA